MTYSEFNKRVFHYYINRSSSSFFTLSIDLNEMSELIEPTEITNFSILRLSWDGLTRPVDGIPQYFGLLAIQCFAASLMHKDEGNSAKAYQIRLRSLLNLDSMSDLQALFRGGNESNPIQEEIWDSAKRFLKSNVGLELEIPRKAINAGRFVQYPKSQALLTTEDLRYFTQYFSEEYQIAESISYEYFAEKLESRFYTIKKTAKTDILFQDYEKKKRCLKQVYDFYNSWDGQIYIPQKNIGKKSSGKINSKKIISQSLLLVFEDNALKVFSSNSSTAEVSEISISNIFKLNTYKYIYKDLILFNESEYYPGEFEDSRFLYTGIRNFIALNPKTRTSEDFFLKQYSKSSLELSNDLVLYEFCVDENALKSPLKHFIQRSRPISLLGGIKVGRGNSYIQGYGPTIMCSEKHTIINNYSPCDYHPNLSEIGVYKVRTDNYRDYEFAIIKVEDLSSSIQTKLKGWNFTSFKIDELYDIEGCLIKHESRSRLTQIRRWISANLESKNEQVANNKLPILKTLYNLAT